MAVAAAMLLAGCASTGSAGFNRHTGNEKADAAYITKVEQVARQRGVRIVWLNAPTKKPRGIVTERD